MKEYNVRYFLGSNDDNVYNLHITAHDEEQAKLLCGIQARYRHGNRMKVTVVDINGKDHKRSVSTEKPIELMVDMLEANHNLVMELRKLNMHRKSVILKNMLPSLVTIAVIIVSSIILLGLLR